MNTQAPTPDPTAPDRDTLIGQWRQSVASQEPLGPCQRTGCDGTIRATPPVVTPRVVWLEAECDTCGKGVVMPNGRRRTEPERGPLAPVDVLAGGRAARDESARDWREAAFKD